MLQKLLPDLWDTRTELKVKQTEVLVNLLVGNDAFAALPTGYGKSPMLYVLAKTYDIFSVLAGIKALFKFSTIVFSSFRMLV